MNDRINLALQGRSPVGRTTQVADLDFILIRVLAYRPYDVVAITLKFVAERKADKAIGASHENIQADCSMT